MWYLSNDLLTFMPNIENLYLPFILISISRSWWISFMFQKDTCCVNFLYFCLNSDMLLCVFTFWWYSTNFIYFELMIFRWNFGFRVNARINYNFCRCWYRVKVICRQEGDEYLRPKPDPDHHLFLYNPWAMNSFSFVNDFKNNFNAIFCET